MRLRRDLFGLSRFVLGAILVASLMLCCAARETQVQGGEPIRPLSSAHIDLLPLGYSGLSESVRLSGGSNITLDFIDPSHVLLTFNPKKLFTRQPGCSANHDDRFIHAAVLEIPSGKIVREADWYLHDSRRYLWSLGSGQFLLRKLNQLYLVDSQFSEKLVFDSPKQLRWISVTPDGKQILVETREDVIAAGSNSKNKPRVKISFLDAASFAVVRTIELRDEVSLEATSSGFAEVMRTGGNVWLVRFGPQHVNIARVKSLHSPKILYSTPNTMLLGRCSLHRDDYSLSAFTVTGHRLWGQRLSGCRYHSAVSASNDGFRFALSSIGIRSQGSQSVANAAGYSEDLQQTVQVFDTASGKPVLSLEVPFAILDEHNFSLSPDGSLFAVIAGTSIDLYSLPEASDGDRVKYLMVKSDTPGFYAPSPVTQGDIEPLYLSSDSKPGSDGESQTSAAQAPTKESLPTVVAGDPEKSSRPSASASSGRDDLGSATITLKAETRLVALDVVVTDVNGQTIKGLQPSDFVVTENGKPQNLQAFREYSGLQASAVAALPSSPKRPPNVFSNESTSADPQTGAVTVVLLDLLNTPLSDQSFAQAQLIKFLKNKHDGSQFALCTLGSRLQMIQGFTQDGNILLAAAAGKKGSMRYRPLIDPDSVLQPSLESGTATARLLPALDFFVASVKQQQSEVRVLDADRRMFATVDAFAQLARYLSGIPGRKNLVWLSGSFQLGIYPDSKGDSPFIQARSYSDQLKTVANLLEEAHVAVYPVDVRGLVTNPLFAANTNDVLSPISMQGSTPTGVAPGGGVTFAGAGRPVNNAVAIAVMQDQNDQFGVAQIGERATMNQIAADTGGQAFYNANDIARAIRTAAEQGSNYYALSYTPTNKNYDGGFRRIKVSLRGRKFHLAYRSGYYALDPSASAKGSKDLKSSLALAAMQQGSPQSRQIVFSARIVPDGKPFVPSQTTQTATGKSKQKKGSRPEQMQRYSVDYAVSAKELRFNMSPAGNFQETLNFMIAVFDGEGRLVAAQSSQAAVDLKPQEFRDVLLGGLRVQQQIEVPTESAAMRLGVEEVANSHIGTLEISLPVKVPPNSAGISQNVLPPIEPD